ncbi:AMP-binding protein [Streptomyces sp. SHP 1-2]|uniref:AMP-binding protein n=1 Tax=Streptomyces sp. SHP 1-2 TaxID=2769489 RepID=UPI002238155C|nr:AMP-binding protein [Streptomyces sp. SHP 1-2]MCW5251227.1 AMP-binding protein [Streptomyces sp. SHP 1-2]
MIHPSRFPAIDLPHDDVVSYVLEHAREHGGRPALVDSVTGRTLTYGRLADLVDSVAAGLSHGGIGPGDVVAVHAPNSLLYPVACLAALRAGAVVTPVSALATGAELISHLRSSGARTVVSAAVFAPLALAARAAGAVDEVVLMEKEDGDTTGLRDLADLSTAAPDPGPPRHPADPADVALLPYSSGTSGTPKGVLLTHAGLTANIAQMSHAMRVGPGHRVLAVLPFFHAYGFSTLIGLSLRNGATLVVVPRFRFETFLDTLAEHRVTHALIAPPIAVALLKHPAVDPAAFATVRQILCSAAPLKSDVAAGVERRTGVPVVQAYGMTEMSPGITVPPEGETPPPGSVGRLLPMTELRVVSVADGRPLGPGEEGELWVRGPQVMKGYAPGSGEPGEQALDAEGWLRTGDVGLVDDDGWIRLRDRVKDLIKYKGYQIAPGELEGCLLGHPLVADAGVAGAVDEYGEEYPRAYVVLAPEAGPRPPGAVESELMEYVAARVAPYKKIREVRIVDALPRSGAGKVLRRELAGTPAARSGRPTGQRAEQKA